MKAASASSSAKRKRSSFAGSLAAARLRQNRSLCFISARSNGWPTSRNKKRARSRIHRDRCRRGGFPNEGLAASDEPWRRDGFGSAGRSAMSAVATAAAEPNPVPRRLRRSMPMPEPTCGIRSTRRFRQLGNAHCGGDRMEDRADHVAAARGLAASRRDGGPIQPIVQSRSTRRQGRATGRRDVGATGQSRTGHQPGRSAVRSLSARAIRRLR